MFRSTTSSEQYLKNRLPQIIASPPFGTKKEIIASGLRLLFEEAR